MIKSHTHSPGVAPGTDVQLYAGTVGFTGGKTTVSLKLSTCLAVINYLFY